MKRILSFIISIFLLISVIPFTVSAESDFIEIYTADDLRAVDENLSRNYKLMNDIDLSTLTASGGKYNYNGNGWEPIGSGGVYGKNAFTGVFDGNGHTISGIRIIVSSMPQGASSKTAHIGLFAYNSGVICNLTIDGKITSNYEYGVNYIGGITAYNNGTIRNCANKCSLYMTYNNISQGYIGGIAGYNKNTIEQCFNNNSVSISGNKSSSAYTVNSAGIACGTGSIYNCYNTGAISASHKYGQVKALSGGINICEKDNVDVSFCYNVGKAEYTISNIGRSKCYYLIDSGYNTNNWSTWLTDEQMQNEENFPEFDFENIWEVDTQCGYSYPQLKSNRQVAPKVVEPVLLYILGDSDSNGKVNISDATQIQLYIAQLPVMETFSFDAADVNTDDKLSVIDVTNIQRFIAQLGADSEIGNPVYA